MTTDEDRLAEVNEDINLTKEELAEKREELRILRMERSTLQQRIREDTPSYQQARGALRAAAVERPRSTAPVDRREDT